MRDSSGASASAQAEACYRLGTERYPEIRWAWPEFARAFDEHAANGAEAQPTADDYVRLACLADRPGATRVLDRDYIEPLRGRVSKVCLTPETTDAALQELRGKLLLPPTPRLASYRATGDFRVWLRVVAMRTAIDVAQGARGRGERRDELPEHLEAITLGPEAHFVKEEWRVILRSSLQVAVKRLPEGERHALRMHTLAGASIDQIGEVLSVHRATAARWLLAAKDKLRVYLREELALRIGSGGSAVELFLEEMPSRLDVSLSRIFGTTGVLA
jgi:RNA polymerase sigma-70 factor (ECF subfamily)